jgi:hypothetical protein
VFVAADAADKHLTASNKAAQKVVVRYDENGEEQEPQNSKPKSKKSRKQSRGPPTLTAAKGKTNDEDTKSIPRTEHSNWHNLTSDDLTTVIRGVYIHSPIQVPPPG